MCGQDNRLRMGIHGDGMADFSVPDADSYDVRDVSVNADCSES